MINPMEVLGNMPQKIEAGNMTIFEKKEPVYNSLFLGVPVKYILGGIIIYKAYKFLR